MKIYKTTEAGARLAGKEIEGELDEIMDDLRYAISARGYDTRKLHYSDSSDAIMDGVVVIATQY